MVSPELIRRYPFFAGLSMDQIKVLAEAAEDETVEAGHYFFHEGEELPCFCIALEGAIAIVIELPERGVEHKLSEQLAGEYQTKEVVISTVGPGEAFAWSALVPPHKATAGVKATTRARVIHFRADKLRAAFEEDCGFGYLMMRKVAQVIRDRLRDTRIQSLPYFAAEEG